MCVGVCMRACVCGLHVCGVYGECGVFVCACALHCK